MNGGARPGAGRPRKAVKYAAPIAAAEDRLADRLPRLIDDLLKLAHGGWWEEEEELQPARLVEIGQGEVRTLAYPEKDPDALVVVRRRRRRMAPDRQALIYAIDRLMGRPTTEGGEAEAMLTAILRQLNLSSLTDEQIDQLTAGADPIAVLLGALAAQGPGGAGAPEASH